MAYTAEGLPLWTNRYDGPAADDDVATAVAVDHIGNVFVTGLSVGQGSQHDFATLAYTSAGVPLWTNRYNGPANGDDRAIAIAVDKSGNVVVTGTSTELNGDFSYATLAYSGSGPPLWTNRFTGLVGGSTVRGMALDRSGNVVVTGASVDSNGNYDYLTVKYSSSIPCYIQIQTAKKAQVLNWDNSGYRLQSAPSTADIFTNVPDAASPYTNYLSGTQQYFRLIAP